MSIDIFDLEQLTPGSVWLRENGKQNTVLLVTNEALPTKLRDKHPPQVIYVDDDNNVFNQPRDHFVETRKFYNVNPELEHRLNNLLGVFDESQMEDSDVLIISDSADDEEESEDDESNILDMQDDSLTDETLVEDTTQVIAAGIFNEASKSPLMYSIFEDQQDLPILISAERLQELTESYSQEPNWERGWIVHKIVFRLESDVSVESIHRTFSADPNATNALFKFTVNSEYVGIGGEVVEWETSLGAWPYLMQEQQYLQVMVATTAKVPVDDMAEKVAEVIAREASEVDPLLPAAD